ncbi:hypothetical protein GR160_08640 [Flavobacterium sp. Sd200]|uniref:hypothetical protein n=1 Tax=Flavobacterium sp. Sd200 TaxID=2692211 RepID=UPI001367AF22|nr:hypothetical protein [Flavobacterium sp. Sd200]MXN91295.1 hypothetical protein [Flavobacterium sp. Sd200]
MFFSKFFGKKKPQTTKPTVIADLPALNAWGTFFQGSGFILHSRFASTIPGEESNYIYLKSYPEVFELERKLFAEWLTTSTTGVYLQQWDENTSLWALVFVSFTNPEFRVIKTNINTPNFTTGYENGKPVIIIGNERVEME